jgi:hypothetical protein
MRWLDKKPGGPGFESPSEWCVPRIMVSEIGDVENGNG